MKQQLVRELVGGEWYEYVPLGKFIVSAPAVCRGRPTFKYTRIEVAGVLERLAAGHAIEALITDSRGRLSRDSDRRSRHPGRNSYRAYALSGTVWRVRYSITSCCRSCSWSR